MLRAHPLLQRQITEHIRLLMIYSSHELFLAIIQWNFSTLLDDHFAEMRPVKTVSEPSLIAALAGAPLMLNAAQSSGPTDFIRSVARSGQHGIRVNQESRLQYLE
jgi:hypothetical protein